MNIPTYLSGALFMKAYRLLRLNVTTCLSKFSINPTSWVLLGIIRETKDGIRLAEVANLMNVKAPLITTLVQDLIAKDLIELLPHHTDKRVKLLLLTASGKIFVKKVEIALDKSLRDILVGTSNADLAGFEAVLEAIIRNSTEVENLLYKKLLTKNAKQ